MKTERFDSPTIFRRASFQRAGLGLAGLQGWGLGRRDGGGAAQQTGAVRGR